MSSDQSSHGFGLAVTSLFTLAAAYLVLFYVSNPVFSALVGLLSAIIGSAAYLEARRANGPKKFTASILLLAILGTLFILVKAGLTGTEDPENDLKDPQKEVVIEKDNEREKARELEEKLEKLEQDNPI